MSACSVIGGGRRVEWGMATTAAARRRSKAYRTSAHCQSGVGADCRATRPRPSIPIEFFAMVHHKPRGLSATDEPMLLQRHQMQASPGPAGEGPPRPPTTNYPRVG